MGMARSNFPNQETEFPREEKDVKQSAEDTFPELKDDRQPGNEPLYDFDEEIKKFEEIIKETEVLFDDVCKEMRIEGLYYEDCRLTILDAVHELLRNMIDNARRPNIYLLGRSKNGKTSLINAVTTGKKGKVDSVAPTTPCATEYDTHLGDTSSWWKIVDSSGYFPTTNPSEQSKLAAKVEDVGFVQRIKDDIQNKKPDVILYVVCCIEVGNLENDLNVLKDLLDSSNVIPPIIVVLSKADIFEDPRFWPPENCARKQVELQKLLDYMAKKILGASNTEPVAKEAFYGYKLEGCDPFFYVIPTATLERCEDMPEMRWNIARLMTIVGSELPAQSWLHYYKAYEGIKSRKKLSTQIIHKLCNISVTLTDISLPGTCTKLFLLQMIMIGIIAKLSGHSVPISYVYNFLVACDILKAVPAGVATAFVTLLRSKGRAVAVALGAGVGAGAGIGRNLVGVTNASSTYCVGKSAEWYFFRNQITIPDHCTMKWKFRPK